MGTVKRLLLAAATTLTLAGLVATPASADPTPTTPPTTTAPTTSARPNVPAPGSDPGAPASAPGMNLPATSDNLNDFQKDLKSCLQTLGVDTSKLSNDSSGGVGPFAGLKDAFTNGLKNAFQTALQNALPAELVCTQSAAIRHPLDAMMSVASATISVYWGDPVGKFTKAVLEGNKTAFGMVMTFWMTSPIPALSESSAVTGLGNLIREIEIFALALGIGVGGVRLAIARRHAVADGAEQTAKSLWRTMFALWTLPALVTALHQAGDSFSLWVINQSAGNDPTATLTAINWIDDKTGFGPVVSLLLAGVGLLGSIAQLIALLIREAVLAVAVAVAPIAAASSATSTGHSSWSSITSYVVASLLFKPAASLIYALAFWSASSKDAASAVVGTVLLALAGFSLPTILRVVAPAAASIAAGGAQTAALGAVAAGAIAAPMQAASRGLSTAATAASGGAAAAAGGAGAGSAASGAGSAFGRYTGGGAAGASGGGAAGGSRGGGAGGAGGGGPTGAGGGSRSGGGASGSAGPGGGGAGARVLGGMASLAGSAASGARTASHGLAAVAVWSDGTFGHYQGQVPR